MKCLNKSQLRGTLLEFAIQVHQIHYPCQTLNLIDYNAGKTIGKAFDIHFKLNLELIGKGD